MALLFTPQVCPSHINNEMYLHHCFLPPCGYLCSTSLKGFYYLRVPMCSIKFNLFISACLCDSILLIFKTLVIVISFKTIYCRTGNFHNREFLRNRGVCTGFYESSMTPKMSQRFVACSLTSKPY